MLHLQIHFHIQILKLIGEVNKVTKGALGNCGTIYPNEQQTHGKSRL